ncbi:hypothetical protein H6504_03455 [Candidatus Woesearchaeota archaeon]|nr:hypothetical protein [Candidatus Woesearchaeota archaeon]
MSRGQLANQAFIYILSALIFSLVLIIGYRAVDHFLEVREQVEMIDLKMEIESTIENVAPTQDRIERELKVPSKFTEICFVDMTQGGSAVCATGGTLCNTACFPSPSISPVVCDAWESNLTNNVYLLPMADVSITTARIELQDTAGVETGYLCLDTTRGFVRLIFSGRGDRAVIQESI